MFAAPGIQSHFNNPKGADARYHMLLHLDHKFAVPPPSPLVPEPRAAMILNRFTRTLTVMYTTHSVESILGISAEEVLQRSFYDGIDEDCLVDAVDAIERAKENDSIAFLRFVWDPSRRRRSESQDVENLPAEGQRANRAARQPSASTDDGGVPLQREISDDDTTDDSDSDLDGRSSDTSPQTSVSDTATAVASARPMPPPIEIEAIISCTSDGLVVIIKKAGPLPPHHQASHSNGVFAAPWAPVPLIPQGHAIDPYYHYEGYNPHDQQRRAPRSSDPVKEYDFMRAIQYHAVFAWSLRSINKDILMHAKAIQPPSYIDQVGVFPNPKGTYDRRSRRWAKSKVQADAVRQQVAQGFPPDPNSYASLGYAPRRHPYHRRGRK